MTPGTVPPDIPHNLPLLSIKRHILGALRNSSEGGARLHRQNSAFTKIDHRIAVGVIVFLRSSGLIVPAGPIDADGGVIGKQGKIPTTVYVMLALRWGHDMLSLSREEFKGLKRKQPTTFHQ